MSSIKSKKYLEDKTRILENSQKLTEKPIPMDLSKEITKMFELSRKKKQRISEFMCESIKKTKRKASKSAGNVIRYHAIKRPVTASDFKKFTEKAPHTEMSRFQEKDILNKLHAKGLEITHKQLLADMMKEVKLEFVKISHYAGVSQKIKVVQETEKFFIEPYKFRGRTENYHKFLKIKNDFRYKWILYFPIIKKIHNECVLKLPHELLELHFSQTFPLRNINAMLKEKIQNVSEFIYEFYKNIIVIVNKEQLKQTKKISQQSIYLKACTGIISVHISKSISHTLSYIVKATSFDGIKPYLRLNASFDNGLVLSPNLEDVISSLSDFLDKIIDTGKEIYVLERHRIKGYENKYISLCLTDEFVNECKNSLSVNITQHYTPILEHLEHISSEFSEIYSDINSEDFLNSIADIDFETGCKRINYYRDFLNRIMFIPDHEFFQIGKLYLIDYREQLHQGLNKNINAIFEKLRAQHFWEVNDLCETFEMIKIRAQLIPLTTEELIESGKYMTLVKNEHLDELTIRVHESVASLCHFIDLGILTEEHIQMNCRVIHWLNDILPIIDEHAITFDQLKFDAEERLQKVVEDVNVMIQDVFPLLVILDEMDDITKVRSYLRAITIHMSKIKEINSQIIWINNEEVILSFPKSIYSEFDDLKNYVYPFYHLLKLCLDVQRGVSVWQDGSFDRLTYESTNEAVENFYKELTEIYKDYRKKLRQAQDENLPIRFKGTVDDPDILNWPAPLKLSGTALKLIEEFKPSVEVMKTICNPYLRKRHWVAMSEIAGVDVTPNAGTTLRKMNKVDFQTTLDQYEIISNGATKEKQLKDQLEQLKMQWSDIRFSIIDFKGIPILTRLDEIETLINDQTISILVMKSSVFVKTNEKNVTEFYNQIKLINSTIQVWQEVQTILKKLVPIFSTGNLHDLIPNEYKGFEECMQTYHMLIQLITKTPEVIQIATTATVCQSIAICLKQLEFVYKGIKTYLEFLKDYFPRFYFLSDDDLIRTISNLNYLHECDDLLKKLFLAVSKLNLHEKKVVGICNNYMEHFDFVNEIDVNMLTFEQTCKQILNELNNSLQSQLSDCYKLFRTTNLKTLLSKYPVQIVQMIYQIYWTEKVESALGLNHNIKLRLYYQKLDASIKEKIDLFVREDINNYENIKLKCLIMNDFNNRTVIGKILEKKGIKKDNFDWEAHFKYYYKEKVCSVKTLDVNINYMFEYIGVPNIFVSTSITDRCIRTLINAFHLYFNGLLTGYEESGKTETVTYIARALGVFIKTFNCSSNLSLNVLRDFLKGTTISGAWILLENFGSLPHPVMSTLSQDILQILTAKKEGIRKCQIGHKFVPINKTCFLVGSIKMGNLHELIPQNLKAQFRTVMMLTPDFYRISEAFLYSYGFKLSNRLAKKLLCFLDVCKNILTKSNGYKYNLGMRKLKKILSLCEVNKFQNEYDDEESILCYSLIITFEGKIKISDADVFSNILKDIFPNYNPSHNKNSDFNLKIDDIFKGSSLINNSNLTQKITNLCEIILRNENTIIIGKSCSGKTNILKTAKKIVEQNRNITIKCHFISPNCLDHKTLYGQVDPTSNKWNDGIITKLIRNAQNDEQSVFRWIIFDGALNSSWTENIITLLKENAFFTESGEILLCSDRKTIMFEVEKIKNCSPTILTRCSMVYVDTASLSWDMLVKSWAISCTSEWINGHQEQISDILIWLINPCLSFISKNCKNIYYTDEMTLVKTTLLLTQVILDDVFSTVNHKEEDPRNFSVWIQATLIQAVLLGLGSLLDSSSKYKFDEFYKGLWKGLNQDYPYPQSFEKLEVSIPHEGLIFNYQYVYRQRGTWKLNQDLLKVEKIIESSYMREFLIPTADTLRNSYFLNLFINYDIPIIFIGSSGKTLLVEDTLINKLNQNDILSYQINSSANITPKLLQNIILSKLYKGKHGKYSPPPPKKFLLSINDLNLTISDKNDNFTCLELMRQFLNHQNLYEFESGNEIFVDNINIIGTIGLNKTRNKYLDPRFLRHFAVLGTNLLSDETVNRIYSSGLLHTWKKKNFPSDIVSVTHQIVDATQNIYKLIKVQYKPTLSRGYYMFGLDTFSKVIQGCCLLKKESYDSNKKIYMKLWAHEVLRVFGDRLSPLDNKWLLTKVKNCFSEIFGEEDLTDYEEDTLDLLIFGNLNSKEQNNKKYEEITDLKVLGDIIADFLDKYNQSFKDKLDLVFFNYSLFKLIRLCRILSMSPGNAILIGFPGTGRQTMTKLAAFIYKCKLFQPSITLNYNIETWNCDVKLIMKEAGALQHQCVFLVREEQLLEEIYLQNIDYLLRNGEVHGIHTSDDMQEILELTRLAAQGGNKNIDISASSIFLYFNKICRENLHIILSLNYNSQIFRKILINYPSLMKCHIISWNDWPDEAYQLIAHKMVESLNLLDNEVQRITEISSYIHRQSQNIAKLKMNHIEVNVTSSAFTHFIKLFSKLFLMKGKDISTKKDRYEKGLSKLSYAAIQIENMQKALAMYQPQLADMTKKASEMTDQIALETIEVEKASALVRQDEKTASEQAIVAQKLKSECESELAQAIPILEDAISALNTLKPSDITLVKSMKNPPDAIKLVMAAVCVIKDVKPDRIPDPSTGRKIIDYWSPSKRILGDMNFLQTLKDFDKDHIKPEIMVKIRKEYLPHKDFKPHTVAKASSAAEGLCKWIIAMDMYDKVAKEVAPKKVKLEKAEREYAGTVQILNQKKEEVARIEEKLASLNALLEDAIQKQLKLQQEVDSCNKKLSSAQKLIGSLGDEKVRWSQSVENLEKQQKLLSGNILLSSSIIAYLSHLDSDTRVKTIINWRDFISENELFCSDDFNIIKSLSSKNDCEFWIKNSLPNDTFFFENVVMHSFANLQCIIIDPDYLAKTWIIKTEKRNNLNITKFTSQEYTEKLKYCLKFGKPLLFHEIKESFPPCLNSFFSIDKSEIFNNKGIYINGENVIVNPEFRFYLVGNLRNPKFQTDIYKRCCFINFTVTAVGLEDEMLKIVTEIEKPELRKLKQELFKQSSQNRKQLIELETKILTTLCDSQIDILDDETSIKILDQSKDLAQLVREKQKDTKTMEEDIKQFTKIYKHTASSAADLYFCISKLHMINYIYQYSLVIFKDLFHNSILISEKSLIIEKRCNSILNTFIYAVFRYISQSLFEKDKLAFLFLLTISTLTNRQQVSTEEILFFLKTDIKYPKKIMSNPAPDWLSEETWVEINDLESVSTFDNFKNIFIANIQDWKNTLENTEIIMKKKVPLSIKLTNFQKLILAKIFTPKLLFDNLITFFQIEIGEEYLANSFFDSHRTYNESNSLCPLLLITVPSSNIRETIYTLAGKKMVKHTFCWFSVGNDNSKTISQLIDTARTNGSWVLLENCHLSQECLQVAEEKIDGMDFENTHENFRLWLAMEAKPNIPFELLQKCMKIVDDHSVNLKENVLRLYQKEPINNSTFFHSCPGKQEYFSKLLYGLTFFHCVLLRRDTLPNFRWKCDYIFDQSDFNSAINQLAISINHSSFTVKNFEKLYYMINHCHYMNYMDNYIDIIFLENLIKDFVNVDIFQKKYYHFGGLKCYNFPKKMDHQDFVKEISKLPEMDNSQIFGLNALIDATFNQNNYKYLNETVMAVIKPLDPKTIEENEFSLLNSIEDLKNKLPSLLNVQLIETNYICRKEIKKYNKLLLIIQESLDLLKNCISGSIPMSPEYVVIAKNILENVIPNKWITIAFSGQMTLSSFITDLKQKVEYFHNFIAHKNSFWLGAFHSPKALMYSLKIDFSRQLEIPLEEIKLEYNVAKLNSTVCESKPCIININLFGAKWDTEHNKLIETSNTLYDTLPPIIVSVKEDTNINSQNRSVECPLYPNMERENIIDVIPLPTDNRVEHWIKRGVKLFCQKPVN